MKTNRSCGTGLDHAADVIAVTRLILHQRENQHLSTALFPFGVRGRSSHICNSNICEPGCQINSRCVANVNLLPDSSPGRIAKCILATRRAHDWLLNWRGGEKVLDGL